MFKNAEDLKCGDRFTFRDVDYVTLLSFTDDRHSQTMITCVRHSQFAKPVREVAAIRFHRRFRVEVVDHLPVELTVLHLTDDEVKTVDVPDAKPVSRIF